MGDDWKRALHQSWRTARRQGWTRSRVTLRIGWVAPDQRRREALAEQVLADAAWIAAPPEDYEPETNSREFIARTLIDRPTLSELEQLIHSARAVAREFDSEIHRVGLGAA